AVCPSSSPAAASTNAPVHSETMRRPRDLASRSASSTGAAGTEAESRVGSTTMVCAPASASSPCGTSTLIPPSVITDGAGPQTNSEYSGPPDAVVMIVPKTSFATASSNSVTLSQASAATRCGGGVAVLSCTLSIMPLSRRRGQGKAGTMRGIHSDHRTSSVAPDPDDLVLGDPLGLRPSGPADRGRARAFGASLDAQLAAGVPPESSRLLAARAREIVTLPRRQGLARDWEHLLRVARSTTPGQPRRVRAAPIAKEGPAIRELAERLGPPLPVGARGVAMATVLLT